MNRKLKRLFSDTLVFAAGNVLAKLVLFLLLPLYTSAMTADEYGTAELICSTAELLLPLVTLCLHEAVFRFSIDKNSDHAELLSHALAGILKSFAVVFSVILLAELFLAFDFLWYLALILFSWGIRQLFAQFARGTGRAGVFAACGVIQALSLCLFNFLFLTILPMGVNGYLLAIVLANLVAIVYLTFVLKIHRYIHFCVKDRPLFRSMLVFSVPMIPSTLFWWFVNSSARYILLFFCGAGIAGLFTAAGKLPAMIHLLSTTFQQAWQFSSAKEIGNRGSGRFFTDVFRMYSVFLLTVTSALIAATPLIARIVLRGEFYEAWVYVPVLLISACLNGYSVYFSSFYTAVRKNQRIMLSTFAGAVLNLAVCFAAVPLIGVYGALIANWVSHLAVAVLRLLDTRKYAPVKIDIVPTLTALALTTLQAVLLTVFGNRAVPISGFLFGVVLVFNMMYCRIRFSAKQN